jgi:hypothetical protein
MTKREGAPKEATSNAEPMVFETFTMPNLTNERGRLAREAASLGKVALVERAAAVGVATVGSKAEIVERVQDAARND